MVSTAGHLTTMGCFTLALLPINIKCTIYATSKIVCPTLTATLSNSQERQNQESTTLTNNILIVLISSSSWSRKIDPCTVLPLVLSLQKAARRYYLPHDKICKF